LQHLLHKGSPGVQLIIAIRENSKGTMFCGKDGKSQGEQENFV
jgi:hypothetical protein